MPSSMSENSSLGASSIYCFSICLSFFYSVRKNIVEVVASHMDLEQLHMLLQVVLRIGFVSQRLDKFFPERSRPRYSVHFCHRI